MGSQILFIAVYRFHELIWERVWTNMLFRILTFLSEVVIS